MVIKNKADFLKALGRLKPEDKEDLKFARDRLQKVIDSASVSEESIKEMFAILSLLHGLYGRFVEYNILWLKQGYMED